MPRMPRPGHTRGVSVPPGNDYVLLNLTLFCANITSLSVKHPSTLASLPVNTRRRSSTLPTGVPAAPQCLEQIDLQLDERGVG